MSLSELFKRRQFSNCEFSTLIGQEWSIEGGIGAGKTTLGEEMEGILIENGLNAKFYPEYKNDNFLNLFINNQPKYAFSYQICMLFKRIEIYKEGTEFSKRGGVAIFDRSGPGDYAFKKTHCDEGNINEKESIVYNSIFKNEVLIEPHFTIYLDVDLEVMKQRIIKRGNRNEIEGYKAGYHQKLKNSYEFVLFNKEGGLVENVIRVPYSDDLNKTNIKEMAYSILREIEKRTIEKITQKK